MWRSWAALFHCLSQLSRDLKRQQAIEASQHGARRQIRIFIGVPGAIDPNRTEAELLRAGNVPAIGGLERDCRPGYTEGLIDQGVSLRSGLEPPHCLHREHTLDEGS